MAGRLAAPGLVAKDVPISSPSKNAPYLVYLLGLQAAERLPVHQCFVDLICQVKVFKDPVPYRGSSSPGWRGWIIAGGGREVLPPAIPALGAGS